MVIELRCSYAINTDNHYAYEFNSRQGKIQLLQSYVKKLLVAGSHQILLFPPPIKQTATILVEIS